MSHVFRLVTCATIIAQFCIPGLDDDVRPGRSKTPTHEQSVTLVADSLQEDRRVTLFSVDEIGDSEMVFGEMRPRIRHRLPCIHITFGENLRKTQPVRPVYVIDVYKLTPSNGPKERSRRARDLTVASDNLSAIEFRPGDFFFNVEPVIRNEAIHRKIVFRVGILA
ncbi:hypothetical protein ANN_09736 [Periplaneta americana]|uniref:Uncharacterized protein n=1 Tax=Periplaneta americana TaxID=6978 RepID=A0ABQ8TN55_PERAM|nr:hypothetical protein ANN_09736 [Periplaneta americana]